MSQNVCFSLNNNNNKRNNISICHLLKFLPRLKSVNWGVKVKKKRDDVSISYLILCFLLWNASFIFVEIAFSDENV